MRRRTSPLLLSLLLVFVFASSPVEGQTLADDPGVQSALKLLQPLGMSRTTSEIPAHLWGEGTYGQSFGREVAVLIWEGELAMVSFPTENPMNGLTKLRHLQGDTFRRIRSDKELGEEITFQIVDGEVLRMWRNNNFMEKVR
jgi:hypothetical protein